MQPYGINVGHSIGVNYSLPTPSIVPSLPTSSIAS